MEMSSIIRWRRLYSHSSDCVTSACPWPSTAKCGIATQPWRGRPQRGACVQDGKPSATHRRYCAGALQALRP
jgi:hypothetical protein